MPRYFFDVYNGFDSRDPDGVELPDLNAVRHQVRQTLPSLIKDIEPSQAAAQFRVDVRDAAGRARRDLDDPDGDSIHRGNRKQRNDKARG